MTAADITIAGRELAERLMTDACIITRPADGQVYDEQTDSYVTPSEDVYAGPCRVRPRDNADRPVESAGESLSLWPFVVSVPMSVTGVELDDVVTVTASPLDSALAGTELRVRQVTVGTYLTARRLGCEVQAS